MTLALFVFATVVVELLLLLLMQLLLLVLLLLLLLLVLNGIGLMSCWSTELTGCGPSDAAMIAGALVETVEDLAEVEAAAGVDAIIFATVVVGPID